MKFIFLVVIISILVSFKRAASQVPILGYSTVKAIQDTVIVKYKNELRPHDTDFVSKSYSYIWVTGNDTLDFKLIAREYEQDSSLHLRMIHMQPILFSTALKRISNCLNIIQNDFQLANLKSLYFPPPIYYADLSHELSSTYKKAFEQKTISNQMLNQFLLKSNLSSQINFILKPYGKTTSRYGVEKFYLLRKENYYLKNVDFVNYPDFVLDGAGISVRLTDK